MSVGLHHDAWSGQARQEDGCIVSFEAADGSELTLHKTGPLRAALRAACDDALAVDESFRVVAYSTPQTILTDMSGGRMDYDGHGGQRVESRSPEATNLSAAGLAHMAHERLRLYRAETGERGRRLRGS